MTAVQRGVGFVIALGLFTGGCAATNRDLRPRDYWPTRAEWKRATVRAIKDRGTWIPATGAAIFSIDDWDREISEWAVEETPIFGSPDDASEASDNLLTTTRAAMIGTALAVPNGPGAWEFKPERLGIEIVAVRLNNLATSSLKSWTQRERPDASDDRSFPSGHSSEAFVQAALACRNVDEIEGLSAGGKTALKATFRTIAAGTAWARVEAGVHYPSDVSFGAALGNFLAIFVHDAFLPRDSRTRVGAFVTGGEASFTVGFTF